MYSKFQGLNKYPVVSRSVIRKKSHDVSYAAAVLRQVKNILNPRQVTELLNSVLRSTYFLYKGSFHEQTDGAAMGSPVSAVIANLFMEDFEENALREFHLHVRPEYGSAMSMTLSS